MGKVIIEGKQVTLGSVWRVRSDVSVLAGDARDCAGMLTTVVEVLHDEGIYGRAGRYDSVLFYAAELERYEPEVTEQEAHVLASLLQSLFTL